PDGRVLAGGDAAIELLRLLPGWRWTASILSLPGARSLTRAAYRAVARHRHRLGCGVEEERRPGADARRGGSWGESASPPHGGRLPGDNVSGNGRRSHREGAGEVHLSRPGPSGEVAVLRGDDHLVLAGGGARPGIDARAARGLHKDDAGATEDLDV